MATINIAMTGDWVAVAGEGNVTLSPSTVSMQWATGSSKPSLQLGQALRSYRATSFNMAAGEKLWVRGPNNYLIAVDRDAAP